MPLSPHLHTGSKVASGFASFGRFRLALVQRQRVLGRASAVDFRIGDKWHEQASGAALVFRPFIDRIEDLADRGPPSARVPAFHSKFSIPRFKAYRFTGDSGADQDNIFAELITGARDWIANAYVSPQERRPKGIGSRPGLKLARQHTDEIQDVFQRLVVAGFPGAADFSAEGAGGGATPQAAIDAAVTGADQNPAFIGAAIGQETAQNIGGNWDAKVQRWRMTFGDTPNLAAFSAGLHASATIRVPLATVNLHDDFGIRVFRRASAGSSQPVGGALGSASTSLRFVMNSVTYLDVPMKASGLSLASATRLLFAVATEDVSPGSGVKNQLVTGMGNPWLFVTVTSSGMEFA